MPAFYYARLRRFPDVEAPNLQAWDATDELLVARALAVAGESGIPGSAIAIIGDGYGALTLPLVAAGLHGVRVHQDLVTGRRALAHNGAGLVAGSMSENREACGVSRPAEARHADDLLCFPAPGAAEAAEAPSYQPHELQRELLRGARLVLLQLPKSLAELDEIADAIARWSAPDVVVLAGGRVKHMTLAQNEVLGRYFDQVQPQRAERKSRLVIASVPRTPPQDPPFPVTTTHPEFGLTLCAHGGAFAADRIDIGTRVLLDVMQDRRAELADLTELKARTPTPFTAVDLGCGTGALAAAFALAHPDARVIATDRSAAATRSARATMTANGVADRVTVTLDDAGSDIPDGSVDLILLNPPFHLGATVHEGAGRRLIDATARILRPGGEVWTVFNSGLDHRRALAAAVGPTEQLARTPKFTVTRSVRV